MRLELNYRLKSLLDMIRASLVLEHAFSYEV